MKIPVQTVFRAVVAVILFSLVGAIDHVAAQSSPATEDAAVIILQRPRVHPESRANREAIETSLLQAAAHLSRTNPRVAVVPEWAAEEASGSDIRGSGGTTKVAPGSAGDPEGGVGRGTPPRSARPRDTYRLTVDAIHDPTTPTIALAISGTGNTAGRQASAIPLQDAWDGDLYRALAQQIFYVWAQAQGFQTLETASPPVFVDELPLSELVGSTVSVGGATLYPYSAAPMPDGGVVIGAIGTAVHLGSDFRVLGLPGRSLLEQGDYSSAMTVSATPAGTVITRPSLGNTLYRYRSGSAEPERIRNPLTGQGPMTILPDGSVVITDLAGRRAVRLDGRRRDPLEIFSLEYSFLPAIATGPEGNLWTYDTSRRMILIYSPEGTPIDSIVPAIPIEQAGGVRAMAVGPTGDTILLTTGELWRIDRNGTPIWSTDSLGDGLTQVMGIAWDAPTGAIWLTDYMGQRVVRMQEVGPSLDAVIDPLVREVLAINRELERTTSEEGRAALLIEKARGYAERGALEMAQSVLRRSLDEDPFSGDAIEEIDRLEVALLRREALRLDGMVRRALEEFGRETARDDYRRTIRLYEQILNISPSSSDVRDARTALEERFERREAPPQRDNDLQLVMEVERLFPVLLDQYRRGGAGTVSLTNSGSRGIENLVVSVEIPGFTDGPGPVPIDSDLAPGSGQARSSRSSSTVAFSTFRRTSPSRLLSRRRSVSPASPTGKRTAGKRRFTAAPLSSGTTAPSSLPLSLPMRRWLRASLFEASLPSATVEGTAVSPGGEWKRSRPVSCGRSASPTLLAATASRTWRIPAAPSRRSRGHLPLWTRCAFPRTTLYYRSGDCDDTSALLASLYEAAGLDTAVVTTPGHVMIAFDTREPAANRWMYETGSTTTLEHSGTIWIPVETTVLADGFAAAWREGSALVRRHLSAGEVEILPVREVRDRFPPLPLPSSSFSITEPPRTTVASRVAETTGYTASLLYENARANLENELALRAGSRRIPILNRLGILHGRFGEAERARNVLGEVIALRNDYLPAFINLANIELLEGNPEEALAWLDEAELLDPEDPMVMEMLARAHFAADSGREARRYVEALAERAPERAEALALILPPSGRAALPDGASGEAVGLAPEAGAAAATAGRASAGPSAGGPGRSGTADAPARAAAFRAASLPPVEWPAGE
jgi:tetratricopeptide (TPR) repeat protein